MTAVERASERLKSDAIARETRLRLDSIRAEPTRAEPTDPTDQSQSLRLILSLSRWLCSRAQLSRARRCSRSSGAHSPPSSSPTLIGRALSWPYKCEERSASLPLGCARFGAVQRPRASAQIGSNLIQSDSIRRTNERQVALARSLGSSARRILAQFHARANDRRSGGGSIQCSGLIRSAASDSDRIGTDRNQSNAIAERALIECEIECAQRGRVARFFVVVGGGGD